MRELELIQPDMLFVSVVCRMMKTLPARKWVTTTCLLKEPDVDYTVVIYIVDHSCKMFSGFLKIVPYKRFLTFLSNKLVTLSVSVSV